MIHTKTIVNYNGSMEELVENIGDLYYDSLSEFLQLLSQKLEKDSIKDRERNRIKLADCLKSASENIKTSASNINDAWGICEQFISNVEIEKVKLQLPYDYYNKPKNIIEIHKWLELQKLQSNSEWNSWDNIHKILESKIGKTLYTCSGWADIRGLYEATLYDVDMRVKIGDQLKEEIRKKGRGLDNEVYTWMDWGKIFVDKNTF